MEKPKSTKKIPKEKPVEVEPSAPEIPSEDDVSLEDEEDIPAVPEEFDFMKMMDSPIVKSLLEGGKDLFKKEKEDPDVCEIYIKAPSEVVLKLFKVSD